MTEPTGMTIALVVRSFGGGVGTVTWNQARLFAERGYRVFLLHEDSPTAVVPSAEGITLVPVRRKTTARSIAWSIIHRIPSLLRRLPVDAIDIESIQLSEAAKNTLKRLVPNEGIEAVGFSDNFPNFLYWRPPQPCRMVVGLHGPRHMFRQIRHADYPINERVHRLTVAAVKGADAWYTPSQFMQRFTAAYYGIPQNRIAVIPNAVDTRLFTPAKEPPEPGILFSGRFSAAKGADVLVDIVPSLLAASPATSFTIVGESAAGSDGRPLADHLLQRATEAGVASRITWRRGIPYDDLPALYRRSSLVVLPSEFESFSMTCAEAHASGVPVVATNVGGIPEVVEDGRTGLLVPPEDRHATRGAIERLLGNAEERLAMGRRARERAESRWSYEAVAPRLEALIASLSPA